PAGRPDEEAVVRMLAEAGGFFRDACGASELAIVGSCLGARLGIAVAARDPAVTHVVGVAAPLGVARREPRFALRRRRPDWVPGMAEAVVAAARTARLTFVYGGEDRSYRLFGEFTARAVPAEAAARLEVVAREGVRVHGFLDLSAEPERWLVDTIDAMLSGETAASAASARGEAATPAGSER
ncbi:MAG TPA: hypothetical protein VEO00_04485, partial [Actinomycetota bacterium]|nr:hypothetical protein [Actinomycetota bacterium]